MRRLLVLFALMVAAFSSLAGAQPPQGTSLTFTDTFWRCSQPISELATNGLPLRVTMQFTGMFVPPTGGGVVQFGAGCVGDGDTNTVDVVLDVRGDGLTYGAGDDAIRLMNARPGATDLVIAGHADCGPQAPGAHQDGIQILGGTNIEFRDFTVGDYDAGRSTCQGAGGALFYSLQSFNVDALGGSYIACNHSLLAGTSSPGGEVRDARFRSGYPPGDAKCEGYATSNPCIIQNDVETSNLTCQRYPWDDEPPPPPPPPSPPEPCDEECVAAYEAQIAELRDERDAARAELADCRLKLSQIDGYWLRRAELKATTGSRMHAVIHRKYGCLGFSH